MLWSAGNVSISQASHQPFHVSQMGPEMSKEDRERLDGKCRNEKG